MLKLEKNISGVNVVKVPINLFCDGSHKGTDISPVSFLAEKSETKFFCGCKITNTQPFCDGSHNTFK